MGRGKRAAGTVRVQPIAGSEAVVDIATATAAVDLVPEGWRVKRKKSDPIEGHSFFPSDLTWLYSECQHCFYLKLRRGVKRPGGAMPSIFRAIDEQIRTFCMNKGRTDEVCPQMPGGEFISGEVWLRSRSQQMLGHKEKFCLRGRPDALVRWDDGGYGVVDFKTSAIREERGDFYGKQLESYARALEDPHYPEQRLAPVTRMGLLVFEPKVFLDGEGASLTLQGEWRWIDVPRQGAEFSYFIDGCLNVLEAEGAPEPSENCPYCKYRRDFADKAGASAPA